MNGPDKRCLLDTNTIVFLLQGEEKVLHLLDKAEWIGISIISQIEFLAFTGLTEKDRQPFKEFLERVDVVDLRSHKGLIDLIIEIRKRYSFKLPDAIIVGSAIQNSASLFTSDKKLKVVTEIEIVDFTG